MNNNDPDDPLPFVQLANLTANVMHFLLSKRDEQAENKGDDADRESDERAEAKAQRREFLVA